MSEEADRKPETWQLCNDGRCPCLTIMARDYPVAKVTCGPWGDDYPAIRLVGTSSLEMKAEPYMEQITYGEVSKELALSNARLIAAAPDMLQALIKLSNEVLGSLPLMQALCRREFGNSNYNILIQRAEEARAMAKAASP
jgi:hypothetical protein